MEEQIIALGIVTRPHGIRGDVCIKLYADSVSFPIEKVFLQKGNTFYRDLNVEYYRVQKNMLILRFKEYTDRSSVEALRGCILSIQRAALTEPMPGSFYLADLLGLSVISEITNQKIGVLEGVFFYGGQETWSIVTDQGEEVLFPAVPSFVGDIDLKSKVIKITPPSGLLDLYIN